MVIYIFLKFGMVKVFKTLQAVSNMKVNIFQMKKFNEITLSPPIYNLQFYKFLSISKSP